MVKAQSYNAGDSCPIPDQGTKILCAEGHLSLHAAATTELSGLNKRVCVHQLRLSTTKYINI